MCSRNQFTSKAARDAQPSETPWREGDKEGVGRLQAWVEKLALSPPPPRASRSRRRQQLPRLSLVEAAVGLTTECRPHVPAHKGEWHARGWREVVPDAQYELHKDMFMNPVFWGALALLDW